MAHLVVLDVLACIVAFHFHVSYPACLLFAEMNYATFPILYGRFGCLLHAWMPHTGLLCALRIPSNHYSGGLLYTLNYQGEVVTFHVSP